MARKNNGIVRRPIEYVLVVILLVLIGLLVTSAMSLRRENDKVLTADSVQAAQRPLEGTIDEIDWLTEYDVREERVADALVRAKDQQVTRGMDAAADNIGSAIDETALPSAVCEEIDSSIRETTESFDRLVAAYSEAKQALQASRQSYLLGASETIASSRLARDGERTDSYQLLAQKSRQEDGVLVDLYRAAIEAGVSARRAAFDQAREEYLAQAEQFISSRQAAIEAGYAAFRADSLSALQTARTACAQRGHDAAAIRQELGRAIGVARLEYAEVLRSRADTRATIRQFETVKNAVYDSSVALFEQALKQLQAKYQDLRR